MEINFSEDVQKALDLMDESDRDKYIENSVMKQLIRDGCLAGIAWSTWGGQSIYSLGDNSLTIPSDRTEVVTVKVGNVPDGDRAIVKGIQVYASEGGRMATPPGGGGVYYPYDYSPSPIAEKINMTGVVPEMAKGIVSVATQQEVDHFYDRNNEPARSIYPSHLNRPS